MTDPRFEIVRTPAGYHARFRAANGQIVWTTEVYARRRAALRAIELIAGARVDTSPNADHPEVFWQGNLERPTEVRDIDERVHP
jgi:uncharacterized protein YegP (UPF0339 family)